MSGREVQSRVPEQHGRATPRCWPCHPSCFQSSANSRQCPGTPLALPGAVSHPRRILPGETYLLTRRCCQRTFRLRPSPETNRIFAYCLAFAAMRTGVLIHAACVMSNHHHLVVTDAFGLLPNFLRELHRLTAKALNASQGQWENLWAGEPCNVVRLVTDEDIEDKIAYVVANPIAAGLVEKPEDWPGLLTWGSAALHVKRPDAYFRKDGTCPPALTLRIEPPRNRETEPPLARSQSSLDRIRRLVADKVAAAHQALRAAGRRFLEKAAALTSSLAQHARSDEQRFRTIPTFAARQRDVRDHLRRVEQTFRECYRAALMRWCTAAARSSFHPERGGWP
jgi:putative transposase